MSRIYAVTFENVAVTAGQDFLEVSPADDKPIWLIGFELSQNSDVGDAAEEMLRIAVLRGHTTSGSGGSAATPVPLDPGDNAAGFAAEVNNTTIASAGTTTQPYATAFNIRSGIAVFFTPETYIKANQSNTTLVVRLLAAPADSLSMSGTFWIKEE